MSDKQFQPVSENGTLYNFDPITGIYSGQSQADRDPMIPTAWLVPTGATLLPAPVPGQGKVAVFDPQNGDHGAWSLQNIPVMQPEEPIVFNTADNVRKMRNDMLRASDFTQLTDAPVWVDKEAWAEYRQALRDLSAQENFPDSVVWPEIPEKIVS